MPSISSALPLGLAARPLRCHYRPLILVVAAAGLISLFWFASRYPQLIAKMDPAGHALPSMAFSGEVLHAASSAPIWQKVLFGTVNWLDAMKVGMSFGVLLGAMLHTSLRYYPLKIGKNLYLNSLKGALGGRADGRVCELCGAHRVRGHARPRAGRGGPRLPVQLAQL